MEKEELQKKFLTLQILNEQAKQLQQQLILLEQQFAELSVLQESLNEIEKTKENSEILTPLGGGVFLRTKLQDNKKVLVNVGANVNLEKSVEETNILISMQIEEIKKILIQINGELQNIGLQSQLLQEEIQNISSKNK